MKFLCLVILLMLSSCTVNNAGVLHESGMATLVNSCNAKCQKSVSEKYSIAQMSSLFGKDKLVKNYVVLLELDGKRGGSTYFDPDGAYTSSWGAFSIKVPAGHKTVLVRPSSYNNSPNEIVEFSFEADSGGKYLIGQIGWRELKNPIQINHWHPIVVNLANNEIVYPKENPVFRKYCTRHQEWAGAIECP